MESLYLFPIFESNLEVSDMKKIGIINCFKKVQQCVGIYCFNSLNKKKDAFERYAESDCEIVGFAHCNECCAGSIERIKERAQSLTKAGAETIHISSCIKANCPNYNEFIKTLSKDYDIVEYTHAVPAKL
jgi:predicted metal-binding protein